MDIKIITIDGSKFNNLEEFFLEADRVFAKDLILGHNLDAFNDLLRGGFGVREYGEPLRLIWKYSDKSKENLGYPATVLYYKNKLTTCHPVNRARIEAQLDKAMLGEGETLFHIILDIIRSHSEIDLILE